MPKNIVVCCDGTANEFARDKTNVVYLYATLVQEPDRQITYYHPGLGTMEPPGALTGIARRFTKLLGMAVGYGLSDDVCDAYTFLMGAYQPGDQIFLFGFSRGAYTVRVLAALTYRYGLIRQGNEPLVPYAIRLLTGMHGSKNTTAAFQLSEEFKNTFCWAQCPVHFVGVWDTVSSVGWAENPLRVPDTANNPGITTGRHAIAIDERRAFFRTNLWRPDPPQLVSGPKDMKQVWFPGVHCDVGGGYPEAESGLSRIALEWMLREARKAGLLIDDPKALEILGRTPGSPHTPPTPTADAHESLKGWWRIAEFVPKRHYNWRKRCEERRLNLFRPRSIPEDAFVHESVAQRVEACASYRPTNLPRHYQIEPGITYPGE
jgi:uncharacterized protein (DUF2235 family)